MNKKNAFYPGNLRYNVTMMKKHPFFQQNVITCKAGESSIHLFKLNFERLLSSEHCVIASRLKGGFVLSYKVISKEHTIVNTLNCGILLIDSTQNVLFNMNTKSMQSDVLYPPLLDIRTKPVVLAKLCGDIQLIDLMKTGYKGKVNDGAF